MFYGNLDFHIFSYLHLFPSFDSNKLTSITILISFPLLNFQKLVEMSKLYFFRHAQASYMSDNYDKLSDHGILQAKILGQYLCNEGIEFNQVFSGPLERQVHTCKIVRDQYMEKQLNIPPPQILEGLKEHKGPGLMKKNYPKLIDTIPQFKEWAESASADPKLKRPNMLKAFKFFMDEWATANIKFTGESSWKDFRNDVRTALNNILKNTGKGENIAIFTSGGTISSIVAESLKIQDEKRVVALNYAIRNTSFTTFFYSNNEFNILGMNEIPHLSKDMITFV